MPFLLYDYLNQQGTNQIKLWISSLQVKEKAKLDGVLDKLHMNGDALFPQVLTNSGEPGILKLRVHGSVQLRPLLCRGPVNMKTEYTLLLGAKEVGSKWHPKKAPETSAIRRNDVINDPTNRRTPR